MYRKKKKNIIFNERKYKRKWRFKKTGFLLLIPFAVVLLWFINSLADKETPAANTFTEVQEPTATVETNKTAVTESSVKKSDPLDTTALREQLQSYLKNFPGKYGIYYSNLADDSEFGINQEDKFTAASTIKIPINLYLYEQIKSGTLDAQSKLTYTKADYEEGTGIIQDESFGKEYTLKELSRLSIENSDNIAANMLLRLLDLTKVKDFMKKSGGKIVDNEENITSPKDMGLYMKSVYDFYRNNGTLGNELMGYFTNTEFNDRLPALLPKGVKVAHKIGTQVGVINDVGIVFTNTPYVLSVLSDNVSEDEATSVIANISRIVYQYVTSGGKVAR